MKYTKIMTQTNKLNERLGDIKYHQGRSLEIIKDKKILHFGSGCIKKPNHLMLENLASTIHSVDNDADANANYKCITDVKDCDYEVIFAEHVFEHIPIEELPGLAIHLNSKLSEDGIMIFTIPNIHNFGGWFCDHQHINYAPHDQIAAIFELSGFEAFFRLGWSKQKHFVRHSNFNQEQNKMALFLQEEYGLQLYKFITYYLKNVNS